MSPFLKNYTSNIPVSHKDKPLFFVNDESELLDEIKDEDWIGMS